MRTIKYHRIDKSGAVVERAAVRLTKCPTSWRRSQPTRAQADLYMRSKGFSRANGKVMCA